jgi:predicted phosphate transport protein (TIGR00153 family)
MRLTNPFRSRPNSFLQNLAQQADKTREGLEVLEKYFKSHDPDDARRVEQIEKEADELRRILIDDLNRAFVTPIDREDLFALSRTIDDVLDYAYSTVDEVQLFQLEPTELMRKMVSILREAAEEIHLGVLQLRERPQVALQHATRAKKLENRAEGMYREALAELFQQPKTLDDVMLMLKRREVYRHLSNAADRGDEAGNIISDIVVKMT